MSVITNRITTATCSYLEIAAIAVRGTLSNTYINAYTWHNQMTYAIKQVRRSGRGNAILTKISLGTDYKNIKAKQLRISEMYNTDN